MGTHRPGDGGRDVDRSPGGTTTDQEKQSNVREWISSQGEVQIVVLCELPPSTHPRVSHKSEHGHKAGGGLQDKLLK